MSGILVPKMSVPVIQAEPIMHSILLIRAQKVILDSDLALLYGVTTARLNEQVKRNIERFPDDFMFTLTKDEFNNLKSQFATSSSGWGGRRKLPYVFTEHGAIMAASVLNSPQAVQASIFVVRAFVRLRQLLEPYKEIFKRVEQHEAKLQSHDKSILAIIETLKLLMPPPETAPKKPFGFYSRKKVSEKSGVCSIDLLFSLVIASSTFFISSPLPIAIICVGVVSLMLGILGILKTPSLKGKIGILLSISVLLICCSGSVIFFAKSAKQELQEALFQAALNGNAAKVKELVSQGADINGTNNDGSTLLRNAIEAGNFPMFKALIEAGADINGSCTLQLVLERSYNPWLKRREFDYDDAVKLLLSHGAKFDFNAKDGQRRTCFQNAVENNQIEILKLMLDNGADINLQNDGGVLHWAMGHQAPMEIIELLMKHNPDVNTKDSLGYTPLHRAVFHMRKDVVLALIENGADLNAKNTRNMTALQLAKSLQKLRSGNRQEIIDLLEQKRDALLKQSSDANSLQRNKNETK